MTQSSPLYTIVILIITLLSLYIYNKSFFLTRTPISTITKCLNDEIDKVSFGQYLLYDTMAREGGDDDIKGRNMEFRDPLKERPEDGQIIKFINDVR